MKNGLIYIHGQGGTAAEAAHYQPLFPQYDAAGMTYQAQTPWDAVPEFRSRFDAFRAAHDSVTLIANSIGAYFAVHALHDREIAQAFFISPIVDMEALIAGMMQQAGISEQMLREKGEIATDSGTVLSWKYLEWVRKHPPVWHIPTAILYGGQDTLQTLEMIQAFAGQTGASLTVMPDGAHWFHTAQQLAFLDQWILREREK